MSERPITTLAEDLDAHYASAAEDAVPPPRFRTRPHRQRVTALGWAVVAAGLVAMLLGAGWLGTRMPAEPSLLVGLAPRLRAPSVVVVPALPSASGCPTGSVGENTLPVGCRVSFDEPAMVVTTTRESTLGISADRVTMERGWAVFEVEHRDQAPLRVAFDGGVVEVVGTEFSVFQDEERGHVELVEGAVRIVESGGTTHLLEPGGRFGWERGTKLGAVSARPPHPTTHPTTQPKARPSQSIDEVARLRSKKAYREARALLERLRAQATSSREREVLDYELGTILEAEGASLAVRCKHWDSFRTRYPASRYADAVAKKTKSCATPGP